ncbi:MAG: alkaline phosphatase family protein [bacterium]
MIVIALIPLLARAQNVVFVVIDGARYSETFGESSRTYIPAMDALSSEGSLVDAFYNDGFTYTSRAIPALWCGSWTEVRDTVYNQILTQYAVDPTIFEYFRKQKGTSEDKCVYVLKYIYSLWLPSFHPDYGPDYWPTLHSEGSTDRDVLQEALQVIESSHPQLLWVYFADVDHEGHSGDWQRYTRAIQIADSLVGVLWDAIQADPIYQNTTTMLVTNDHGRHDDAHGGFSGHGCSCDGCRHIMFLAIGPNVAKGHVTTQVRVLPDASVTAAYLLGLTPEYSTGDVIGEIFESSEVEDAAPSSALSETALYSNAPNPFNPLTTIRFSLEQSGSVDLSVYNLTGRRIQTLAHGWWEMGEHRVIFDGHGLSSGIYLCCLQANGKVMNGRMLLVK